MKYVRHPKTSGKRPVTSKANLGDIVIDGLEDFRDSLRKKEVTQRFTVKTVDLRQLSKKHNRSSVLATRTKLGASQAVFAGLMGCSIDLIQAWEQGVKIPNPMASRLLDEINRDPKHWVALLEKTVLAN